MNKKVKLAVVATVAAIAGVVLYQSQAKGVEMSDMMIFHLTKPVIITII